MPYISPLLTNIAEATKKSAVMLDRDFAELEKLQNSVNSIKTFVMNAYGKIEQNLKTELQKIRPDTAFYIFEPQEDLFSYICAYV